MTTATHLIYYDGHFYEAWECGHRWLTTWSGTSGLFVCRVGEETGSIPLDMAREMFEEHARNEAARKAKKEK